MSASGQRTAHPFHMWDGIEAIPAALRAGAPPAADLEPAAAAVAAGATVDLIGCGTSYFAASAIAHLLQGAVGIPARAHNAFEYAAYPPPERERGTLVAISHTGTTPDVVRAARDQRAAGATAIALTDAPDSPLAALCDHVLMGPGGMEPGLAKTRSYATTLQRGYALALAAARLRSLGAPALQDTLARADAIARDALESTEDQSRRLAERFAGVARIVFVGGGPQAATADEAALKVTEAAGLHADAWEVEEAAHGTWASTQPGELVVVLAPEGASADHAGRIARGMNAAGAAVWVLTNGDAPAEADFSTQLPDVDELLMPLFSVLPLYVFAYHLALRRGVSPDTMRTEQPAYARARSIMRLTLPVETPT